MSGMRILALLIIVVMAFLSLMIGFSYGALAGWGVFLISVIVSGVIYNRAGKKGHAAVSPQKE